MANYWREFFSHFTKKLIGSKSFAKLLEMLTTYHPYSSAKNIHSFSKAEFNKNLRKIVFWWTT